MVVRRQWKAKVCLVGEEAVGKTSLVHRFVHNEFEGEYLRTIGTQVSKKVVPLPGGPSVTLVVWDIMGRRRFLDLVTSAYFHRAAGVLGVCDVTRPATLEGLEGWLRGVRESVGEVPVVILGNKADLLQAPGPIEGELEALARRFAAPWFLTSAKTGKDVNEAFELLARRVAGGRPAAAR